MKVGFVVNPIAGMGGSVALKGTDGYETLREAIARGARKVAPARALAALLEIKRRDLDLEFVTVGGEMGADELSAAGFEYLVLLAPSPNSKREDTVRAVEAFISEGVEMILFAGGDGTARDISSVAGTRVPVLGIPSGVKMHSSVFAVTPERAANALAAFAESGRVREAEVMDVDEDAFREGILRAKLFGVVRVPDDTANIQAGKDSYHSADAQDQTDELAKYLADTMEKGTTYILGPGSTTAAVAAQLGLRKTILGVDVLRDGRIIVADAREVDLLRPDYDEPVRIVVSPVGAQGFFFGRGNQQISPAVIRKVGVGNVIVIATPTKLLGTPELRVDTGDPDLDSRFGGHVKVIVGYGRRRLVKVS